MNKTYKIIITLFISSIILGGLIANENSVMEKVYAKVGIASIRENNNNVIIDIYSINEIPIAGVQFEIEPNNLFQIDSISGGICGELGFNLHSNQRGILLGFSLEAKVIPKSISSKIKDNILFSAYGKKIKDINNQKIRLETTLAGEKGNKISVKVNEYIHKSNK